jgi:tRNA splicing ligase
MKQCLMINTKDNRKFFTHEENFPDLIEFSRIFNAEMSIVQIENEKEILDLKKFVPAFCEKKSQKTKYTVLKIKLKLPNNRRKIINRAKKIKKYIQKELTDGNPVSIKALKERFKNYKLTTACLCMHLKSVRTTLAATGVKTIKVGQGKYRVSM